MLVAEVGLRNSCAVDSAAAGLEERLRKCGRVARIRLTGLKRFVLKRDGIVDRDEVVAVSSGRVPSSAVEDEGVNIAAMIYSEGGTRKCRYLHYCI